MTRLDSMADQYAAEEVARYLRSDPGIVDAEPWPPELHRERRDAGTIAAICILAAFAILGVAWAVNR